MFLKFRKFYRKTTVSESLFNKVAGRNNVLPRNSEIFKYTYFYEHLRPTASIFGHWQLSWNKDKQIKQKAASRFRHLRCSIKEAVLKTFAIFTVKHLCWRLFLIKFQAFRLASSKTRTSTREPEPETTRPWKTWTLINFDSKNMDPWFF